MAIHKLTPTYRDLKIEVFRYFPRTANVKTTRALPSGLLFEVHVCTARPRSRGKRFSAREVFCTLKHPNPTFV